MKIIVTILAALALLVAVPGCDVGSRGPTSEQLAEAQTVQENFAPVRQEAEDYLRQHEGTDNQEIEVYVELVQDALELARRSVDALRTAPRDQWNEYKGAAERAIESLRATVAEAREHT